MDQATKFNSRNVIVDGIADTPDRNSIVQPYLMSHGTLECFKLSESRKFYEEFLGLECVRHGKPAMLIRLGIKFHVVCVEVGDQVHPQNVLNHWGLDVPSDEKVDEAYQNALKYKDKYKIRTVMEPTRQHGVYSFYMEDLDHNWWEIESAAHFMHDDMYDFGDRFDGEGNPL
jgi:predicted lactoylglutathione lyase